MPRGHSPRHAPRSSTSSAYRSRLSLAKRPRIPILQASTSEVYGDSSVHPQREEYWVNVNGIGPRSCYDEGKRRAETLFFDYHRHRGLAVKVGRIFNTYGPRMHPNDVRVVSNFMIQALKEQDITLFGDGSQTRSFCYMDDLIAGLVRLMNSPTDFTGPVNLGNPAEISIREPAERIIAITRSPSRIRHRPLPVDDPRRRQPDIQPARDPPNGTLPTSVPCTTRAVFFILRQPQSTHRRERP